MEPALLGVILDTSIMIEAERQRLDVAGFLKLVTERIGEREAALCSISVLNSPTAFIEPALPNAARPAARSSTI